MECDRPMAALVAAVLAVAATLGNGPAQIRNAGPIGVGQRNRSWSFVEPRRGMGSLKTPVGLLILFRVGRRVSNIIRGDQLSRHLVLLPPCPKKAVKAARKEAAASAASGFPTPVPLTKVQALELLKGDLDGGLFLELQSRLTEPKVVPPKKKEDALLHKRIEKDNAKDQQEKLDHEGLQPSE